MTNPTVPRNRIPTDIAGSVREHMAKLDLNLWQYSKASGVPQPTLSRLVKHKGTCVVSRGTHDRLREFILANPVKHELPPVDMVIQNMRLLSIHVLRARLSLDREQDPQFYQLVAHLLTP